MTENSQPTPPVDTENPFLDFTDADLSAALMRAIRTIGWLALIGLPVAWILAGWKSGALLLVGAALSAAGVYESRRLIGVINARLDRKKGSRATGLVIAIFLLRLFLAGAVLYVSLKFLDGSVYALIAGLALAMIALSIEVVKLTRS